jgi:transglutaminase-like putative cysteine protease
MKRDTFLQGAAITAVAVGMPAGARAALSDNPFSPAAGGWRVFEVKTRITLTGTTSPAKAWIPVPSLLAGEWSHPLGSTWTTNGAGAALQTKGKYGTQMLYAEWARQDAVPTIEVVSRVASRDRSVNLTSTGSAALSAQERALYTAPTELIPTDGIVKQTSDKITAGASTELDKAQRIYEWIVANTFRNPKTRGCGLGNVKAMLVTGDLGGKCADINALYVGLARAAGLPARDLYGIRVAPSKFGYKSLGANTADITHAQHCRSEVFIQSAGWVPVDPADVRKVVLEEPPGNLALTDPKVVNAHKTLFGAWEGNWIAYNSGHDVQLPGSSDHVGFLMYPQAELAGTWRDCLSPEDFQYTITSKELTA